MNSNKENVNTIFVISTNHRAALTRCLLSLCLVIATTSCHHGVVRNVTIMPGQLACPGDTVEVFLNADGKVKIEQSGGATTVPETSEGGLDSFTTTVNETTTFTVSRHSSSLSATIEVLEDGHTELIDIPPYCNNCGRPSWLAEFLTSDWSQNLYTGTVTGETGGRAVTATHFNLTEDHGRTPPLRLGDTSNAISGRYGGYWGLFRDLDSLEGCICLGPTGAVMNPGIREPRDRLSIGVEVICGDG